MVMVRLYVLYNINYLEALINRSYDLVISERSVRLLLAQEVAETDQAGYEHNDQGLHPSVMIVNGLALEEDQYVIKSSMLTKNTHFCMFRRRLAADTAALGLHATTGQLSKLQERSNRLRRRIAAWITTQTLFMPEATRERAKAAQRAGPNGLAPTKASDIVLWLPSDLKKRGIEISEVFQTYEWKLREGQAHDALEEVRRTLRLRSHLYKHKDRYARGVKANTRSNVSIDAATDTMTRAAAKYSAAREALAILSQGLETPIWETSLRVLKRDDLRALSEGLHGDTEGTRRPSWIWLTHGLSSHEDDNLALNDGILKSFLTPHAPTHQIFSSSY